MNTLEINDAMSGNPVTCKSFRGVFPADKLPKPITDGNEHKLPAAYIVNTENSDSSGSHWLAIYQGEAGKADVFDSFGSQIETYNPLFKRFLGNLQLMQQQRQQLQQIGSTVCGQYCMFFIMKRSLGYTYEQLIHLFTDNRKANDKMVCQFVNAYFKLKTRVYDTALLTNRLKNTETSGSVLTSGPVPQN